MIKLTYKELYEQIRLFKNLTYSVSIGKYQINDSCFEIMYNPEKDKENDIYPHLWVKFSDEEYGYTIFAPMNKLRKIKEMQNYFIENNNDKNLLQELNKIINK